LSFASPKYERERGCGWECEVREVDLKDTTEDWRERARCERRLVRGDGASSSSLYTDNEKKRKKSEDVE
jgi:hypothetical protein